MLTHTFSVHLVYANQRPVFTRRTNATELSPSAFSIPRLGWKELDAKWDSFFMFVQLARNGAVSLKWALEREIWTAQGVCGNEDKVVSDMYSGDSGSGCHVELEVLGKSGSRCETTGSGGDEGLLSAISRQSRLTEWWCPFRSIINYLAAWKITPLWSS